MADTSLSVTEETARRYYRGPSRTEGFVGKASTSILPFAVMHGRGLLAGRFCMTPQG